jgi:hypothetical protein
VSSRQPPKLAVWLLSFLGVNSGNEPLAGDLLEELRSGRTAGWYWRQAFMAIVTTFGQRVRAYRQDLLEMFLGWSAETSVVIALWIFHIPLGVHGLVLGLLGLAIIWLAMYVEYRVRLYLWRNDDSSGQESDELWDRNISPRLGILWSFGYFVLNDAIVALICLLPGRGWGLSYIVMCHGCWLCWAVIGRLRRTS